MLELGIIWVGSITIAIDVVAATLAVWIAIEVRTEAYQEFLEQRKSRAVN